jgi:transcriptional regulator with XRE-family HTH domain
MDNMKENATFQPNPEQLKFAELYLNYTKKQTLEEIAKEIGIAYSTIWRWFQNNDFVDWINSKKNELLNKSLMARYRTSIRKAEAGDFQFSKMLFEMTGDYRQRTEIGGIDDKPVVINLIPVKTKEDIENLDNG